MECLFAVPPPQPSPARGRERAVLVAEPIPYLTSGTKALQLCGSGMRECMQPAGPVACPPLL